MERLLILHAQLQMRRGHAACLCQRVAPMQNKHAAATSGAPSGHMQSERWIDTGSASPS